MPIELPSDLGQHEVFTWFGFAVAKQQVVERTLGFILVYPELVHLQTQGERDKALRDIHKLTLGQLCHRLAKMGSAEARPFLRDIINVRNMTVHRFWYEDRRQLQLATQEGQRQLISELRAIAQRFDDIETGIRERGVFEFEHSSDPDVPPIPRVLLGW